MIFSGDWNLKLYNDGKLLYDIPAAVPGCVHTDLKNAGIIGDYFYRDNAESIKWIENCDAVYSTVFNADNVCGDEYLLFEGLDVYCDIMLNGQIIGRADDMFISHTFKTNGALKVGKNTLEVKFRSPVDEVKNLPKRDGAFTTERLYTRRIQCTYGWDWVTRFVTMGICKDVHMLCRKQNEIENVYVYTEDIRNNSAIIGIEISFENITENANVKAEILSPYGETVYCTTTKLANNKLLLNSNIDNPELWWPAGYGAQPLYTLSVTTDGDCRKTKFGIRKAEIAEIADLDNSKERKTALKIKEYNHLKNVDRNETTSCFWLLINGVRIFCQGGNWVPCDPFVASETEEQIKRLLETARDGGYNMLRVWGGGVFEKDVFYDECDRLGILVTQDFLMACGSYPEEDETFIKKLNAEAEYAALKYRNHPSLVWWSGDNENATMGDMSSTDFPGYKAATFGIKPILEKYDPKRRFFLSSPYGGVPFASATCGTSHGTFYLGSWFDYINSGNTADYPHELNKYISRFMAEQPSFGMAFPSSMKKFMTENDLLNNDSGISEYHCQNNPFLEDTLFSYAHKTAKGFLGDFTDEDDRIYKLQLMQCEWVRNGFEAYRRNQWFSSGIIYWMYNDCWPTSVSWSFVDYYGNPKPAYYSFKRCANPVISSVFEEDGKINVYVSVNGQNPRRVKGRLYLYDVLSGKENTIAEFCDLFDVKSSIAFSTDRNTICGINNAENVLICDISGDGIEDRSFYCPNTFKNVPWDIHSAPTLKIDGDTLTVTAAETVPAAILDTGFVLDDNCFFLKKGESKKIKILRKEF